MNDLEKVLSSAKCISNQIGDILRQSTYNNYDDLSGLKIDYHDEEQLFLLDELRGILEKLEDAKFSIDYLSRPINFEGTLFKNKDGRYEVENGYYYTSDEGIEALAYDDFYEKVRWIKTSVQHNGNDYYLVGYKDVPMQGLKVRGRS